MKKIAQLTCRTFGFLVCLCGMTLAAEPAGPSSPGFYVFQNGMKFQSPEEGVKFIKDLGYQGIGSAYPKDLAKLKAACEKEGLKLFSVYLDSKVNAENFSYGKEVDDAIAVLKGTDALLELNVQRGANPNDAQAIALVKEIGTKAKAAGLKVVIYPHLNFHIERVDHAVNIAKATGCDNVGVAFNLCHFLKVQPTDDLSKTLTEAKPLLWSVSINGADKDGKDWNTLIRPLDEGSFDISPLLKQLREMRYHGAIGLQCFNIRTEPKEHLARSIQAWKKYLAAGQAK